MEQVSALDTVLGWVLAITNDWGLVIVDRLTCTCIGMGVSCHVELGDSRSLTLDRVDWRMLAIIQLVDLSFITTGYIVSTNAVDLKSIVDAIASTDACWASFDSST